MIPKLVLPFIVLVAVVGYSTLKISSCSYYQYNPDLEELLTRPHYKYPKDNLSIGAFFSNFLRSQQRRRIGIANANAKAKANADEQHNQCEKDASARLLEDWKGNRQTIACSIAGEIEGTTLLDSENRLRVVDRFILDRWRGEPSVSRYRNAHAPSENGPRWISWTDRNSCVPVNQVQVREEGERKILPSHPNSDGISYFDVDATAIRIPLGDAFNSYHRLQAHVNVAMVMIMFDIVNPQLIFMNSDSRRDHHDLESWRLFSDLEPIYAPNNHVDSHDNPHTIFRFREIFELDNVDVTLFTANSKHPGSLVGPGIEHHCSSELFQGIMAWIQSRIERTSNRVDIAGANTNLRNSHSNNVWIPITVGTGLPKHHQQLASDESKVRIVWCTRKPYCCREGGVRNNMRSMNDEAGFLEALLTNLGPDRYSLYSVEFGNLTVAESVQVVEQVDIFVGVHGAGLVWANFLPSTNNNKNANNTQNHRPGGVVEIFGGDRNPVNRHYHNMASLMGHSYRWVDFGFGSGAPYWPIEWDSHRINNLASNIRGLVEDAEP